MGTTKWTEGRRRSFIMSVLRGGYRRWPPKYEVLKEAFVGKKLNKKSNRQSNFYKCASCKKEYPTKEVQVDHIVPVVSPLEGFSSWDTVINNLYCDRTNLQVLCVTCHSKKTKQENEERKK
jgi:5-methylcytosine-specific restriction endonuclease McrA